MQRDIQTAGSCPECGADGVTCRYNHFENDDLRIDSWEHKCPNCGVRKTTAYRSDDETATPESGDPQVCPYCNRRGNIITEST